MTQRQEETDLFNHLYTYTGTINDCIDTENVCSQLKIERRSCVLSEWLSVHDIYGLSKTGDIERPILLFSNLHFYKRNKPIFRFDKDVAIFNSLYTYTGEMNDHVDVYDIAINCNISLNEDTTGVFLSFHIKKWLVAKNIDRWNDISFHLVERRQSSTNDDEPVYEGAFLQKYKKKITSLRGREDDKPVATTAEIIYEKSVEAEAVYNSNEQEIVKHTEIEPSKVEPSKVDSSEVNFTEVEPSEVKPSEVNKRNWFGKK